MADKNLRIKVTTRGAKKASRDLGNVDKGLKGLGKSALRAGAAFFAGRSIISGLRTSIELSAKFEGIERGFNNLAKSTGFTAQAFDKFKQATDGTIGSVELMTQANNAMLLGITDSEDQMAEMFDIAQRLAQALGQDTRFGIESLVTGMGRQSKLMLDNLGIMIDVEKANKDYAKTLRKSASDLTDQEKKQAFVNATMESARGLVEDLGEEQLTTNDAMNQAQASFGDLAIAIGTKLSPLVVAVAKDLGTTADNLTRLLETGTLDEAPAVRTIESVKKELDALKVIAGEEVEGVSILDAFIDAPKISEFDLAINTATGSSQTLKEQITALTLEYLTLSNEGVEPANLALRTTNETIEAVTVTAVEMGDQMFSATEMAAIGARLLGDKLKGLGSQWMELGKMAATSNSQIFEMGKAAAIAGAIIDTYKAASAMLDPKIGGPPPLNFIQAAIVTAAGLANVAQIKAQTMEAATGFDGIVKRPTMFLTGEAGPESVQVTPLTPGMNQNGPQPSISVNISGGVVQEDYIRNELIPALNKATGTGTRLNA